MVVTSNILVWRGIWNVYDAFLYPEDHLFSDLVSLVLGYVLCILMFFLQWPAGKRECHGIVSALILNQFEGRSHLISGLISTKLDQCSNSIWKIIFEDVIMLVATWTNLLLWRGAWDLCLAYVIPDPLVGGWICHWIGTIGLVGLQVRP